MVKQHVNCNRHCLQGNFRTMQIVMVRIDYAKLREDMLRLCGRRTSLFFSSNHQSNEIARQKCLHEKLIEWNRNGCLHILVSLYTCERRVQYFLMKLTNFPFSIEAIFISINYRTANAASSMAREWTDCRWASWAANWWFNRESIDVASSTKVWFKFNIYLSSDKYATCRSERDQLCTGFTL